MFQIRQSQIEQMGDSIRREWCLRQVAYLRQATPQAVSHLDEAALLAVIEQAVGKARGYRLVSDSAVTSFVKLSVFAGPAFDKDPNVAKFLLAPELTPDFKVTMLAEMVANRL